MDSLSDSYLVIGQMAREEARVKGIEILSAASLLSTDIFVYTQFGDTYTSWKPRSSKTNICQSFTHALQTHHFKFRRSIKSVN